MNNPFKHIAVFFGVFIWIISTNVFGDTITVLKADGKGDTYELINTILAPGYNAIESPDCAHPEFGQHIEEDFDTELEAYVFIFSIHKEKDNDRCRKLDRQRNEIKVYDRSPDKLKAYRGNTMHYQWKFKLDESFQSSPYFTHLHQLKAVGGPESNMPIITITVRSGTPDHLEIRYAKNHLQHTLAEDDLSQYKGRWISVSETVHFNEIGQYSLLLKDIKTGNTLLSLHKKNIRLWRKNAEFIRPKWGIYRSLKKPDYLRDETIKFADFIITKKVIR